MSITELITNLENKSFSFDLSQPSSQLPSSLLTSPKYDIADCVSNCSNHGLCKIRDGSRFICQCNYDINNMKIITLILNVHAKINILVKDVKTK